MAQETYPHRNRELVELNLSTCSLGDISIGSLAGQVRNLTRLQKLDLGNNSIWGSGAQVIIQALYDFPEGAGLFHNQIKDQGVCALAKVLIDSGPGARSLWQVHIEKCGVEKPGARSLLECLKKKDPLRCSSMAATCVKILEH